MSQRLPHALHQLQPLIHPSLLYISLSWNWQTKMGFKSLFIRFDTRSLKDVPVSDPRYYDTVKAPKSLLVTTA